MTSSKVVSKSRWGGWGCGPFPGGKFPIYSSPFPNTWVPIKRTNGIVAVAAMLRAALGVHEIRAFYPPRAMLVQSPFSFFLFNSFSLSLTFYIPLRSFEHSIIVLLILCFFFPSYHIFSLLLRVICF